MDPVGSMIQSVLWSILTGEAYGLKRVINDVFRDIKAETKGEKQKTHDDISMYQWTGLE